MINIDSSSSDTHHLVLCRLLLILFPICGDSALPAPCSDPWRIRPATTWSLCAFFLAITPHARPETRENHPHSQFLGTCHKIAAGISGASQVFFPREQLIPFTRSPPKLIAHPSHTSVYIRHFALCSFEHPGVCVLGRTRLGRGREQNCKVSCSNVNRSS